MGALILGIVLIIGYHYQKYHPIRRLELVRSSGYHIYFKAGFSGLTLLSISVSIWLVIDYFDFPSKFLEYFEIGESLTFLKESDRWLEVKTVAIFIIMFLTSLSYVSMRNAYYYFFKDRLLARIFKVANDLESLIIESTSKVIPIRLELDCGKVYIGIAESPDLEGGELKFITILPLLSGYKNDELDIVFTNNYYRHYAKNFDEKSNQNEDDHSNITDFCIVIPVEDVTVASRFSIDAYRQISDDNSSDLIRTPAKASAPKEA